MVKYASALAQFPQRIFEAIQILKAAPGKLDWVGSCYKVNIKLSRLECSGYVKIMFDGDTSELMMRFSVAFKKQHNSK